MKKVKRMKNNYEKLEMEIIDFRNRIYMADGTNQEESDVDISDGGNGAEGTGGNPDLFD